MHTSVILWQTHPVAFHLLLSQTSHITNPKHVTLYTIPTFMLYAETEKQIPNCIRYTERYGYFGFTMTYGRFEIEYNARFVIYYYHIKTKVTTYCCYFLIKKRQR